MNLIRIPNFVSCKDGQEMSKWILSNKEKSFFHDANMGGLRVTTRYADHDNFEYPDTVLNVRKNIVAMFELHEEELFNFYPPFKNGVVASCAFPGDTCYEHLDPVWHDGFHTLHCNVVTQAPEKGGDLLLGGVLEPMKELELCCYLVSKTPHSTTLVEGNKERLMWVFGFCIDDDKWKALSEKYQ